jgi:3-deoxy-7-phosphoheptulonate synthase
MVIKMAGSASEAEVQHVIEFVKDCGLQPHVTRGADRLVVAVVDSTSSRSALETLKAAPGVEDVFPVTHPFQLVSRQKGAARSCVKVADICIGGSHAVVIAGPCSVESRDQIVSTAMAVKSAGATMLRGGAYKPRTSPYDFQGLGLRALQLLREAREESGLPVVTEVMSTEDISVTCEYADMLQVGARNMQNFALLRELAKTNKPILLKRGPSASIKEWLLAAEYLLAGGNSNVVLCERGIRTFETEVRNTLDLAAVAMVRELSHLPVIVDPSHGTGRRELIRPASRAALAIGADGLMIEVHPCPERALSDGAQSLNLDEFSQMMHKLTLPLRTFARALDRANTQSADSKVAAAILGNVPAATVEFEFGQN